METCCKRSLDHDLLFALLSGKLIKLKTEFVFVFTNASEPKCTYLKRLSYKLLGHSCYVVSWTYWCFIMFGALLTGNIRIRTWLVFLCGIWKILFRAEHPNPLKIRANVPCLYFVKASHLFLCTTEHFTCFPPILHKRRASVILYIPPIPSCVLWQISLLDVEYIMNTWVYVLTVKRKHVRI